MEIWNLKGYLTQFLLWYWVKPTNVKSFSNSVRKSQGKIPTILFLMYLAYVTFGFCCWVEVLSVFVLLSVWLKWRKYTKIDKNCFVLLIQHFFISIFNRCAIDFENKTKFFEVCLFETFVWFCFGSYIRRSMNVFGVSNFNLKFSLNLLEDRETELGCSFSWLGFDFWRFLRRKLARIQTKNWKFSILGSKNQLSIPLEVLFHSTSSHNLNIWPYQTFASIPSQTLLCP